MLLNLIQYFVTLFHTSIYVYFIILHTIPKAIFLVFLSLKRLPKDIMHYKKKNPGQNSFDH